MLIEFGINHIKNASFIFHFSFICYHLDPRYSNIWYISRLHPGFAKRPVEYLRQKGTCHLNSQHIVTFLLELTLNFRVKKREFKFKSSIKFCWCDSSILKVNESRKWLLRKDFQKIFSDRTSLFWEETRAKEFKLQIPP